VSVSRSTVQQQSHDGTLTYHHGFVEHDSDATADISFDSDE